MEDLFGSEPPPEAVSRFLAEDQLLRFGIRFSGVPDRLFLLGKTVELFNRLREKEQCASLFGPTGAEWTAYYKERMADREAETVGTGEPTAAGK